jgi:type I restriction enzyme S subunit
MKAQQLKNSILQMAVQGKLVPQDPNDEPASVLLERIRSEKQRLIKEGKIKKNKNESVIFRAQEDQYCTGWAGAGEGSIAKQAQAWMPVSGGLVVSTQNGRKTRFMERAADGIERDITDELPFNVPET